MQDFEGKFSRNIYPGQKHPIVGKNLRNKRNIVRIENEILGYELKKTSSVSNLVISRLLNGICKVAEVVYNPKSNRTFSIEPTKLEEISYKDFLKQHPKNLDDCLVDMAIISLLFNDHDHALEDINGLPHNLKFFSNGEYYFFDLDNLSFVGGNKLIRSDIERYSFAVPKVFELFKNKLGKIKKKISGKNGEISFYKILNSCGYTSTTSVKTTSLTTFPAEYKSLLANIDYYLS